MLKIYEHHLKVHYTLLPPYYFHSDLNSLREKIVHANLNSLRFPSSCHSAPSTQRIIAINPTNSSPTNVCPPFHCCPVPFSVLTKGNTMNERCAVLFCARTEGFFFLLFFHPSESIRWRIGEAQIFWFEIN